MASQRRGRPALWRARAVLLLLPLLLAGTALGPGGAGAQGTMVRAAGPAPEVSLAVSSLYDVSVAPGNWAPVALTVTNRGRSDLQGQLVVTAPVSQVEPPSGEVCYAAGANHACLLPGFAYAGFSPEPRSGPTGTSVTYRAELDLAPRTTRRIVIDVLAGAPHSPVEAEVRGPGGRALATAGCELAVDGGSVVPAVLVLTDDPAAVSSVPMPLPDGSRPQVQLLVPADLPASSAALGTFYAVVVDRAATGGLDQAQRRAVQGYVEAGGTLLVDGGAAWRGVVAGLPAGLLPARVDGTTSIAVPQLARLLQVQALHRRAEIDKLVLRPGSTAILSEGASPLVAEAGEGGGYVVFSALDPAAAPLATWAGNYALMSRLLAPAYQYADLSPGVGRAPGGAVVMPAVAADLGGQASGPPGLMTPLLASGALNGYLEQMPGASPPSAALLGLLLLSYVALVGPICFVVLSRLRRRPLAWVAVPSAAVILGVAAYLTGAGLDRHPISDEVQVAQMAPGSDLAQVSAVGAVYLPLGGSSRVTLAGSGPVSDLGAGDGAGLSVGPDRAGPVGPGRAGRPTTLSVSGPDNSLGGWVASEDGRADGTVEASVQFAGGAVTGSVANNLGVKLMDVYVVQGAASADLGTLPPGGSARFRLLTRSPAQVPNVDPLPRGPGTAAARRQLAVYSVDVLAAEYANASGARPVLVGLAATPFLTAGSRGTVAAANTVDIVVVPLARAERAGAEISHLPAQLVASRGLNGETVGAGPASLWLGQGGFLDYEFVLPAGDWQKLQLDLGTPLGPGLLSTPGTVAGNGAGGSARHSARHSAGNGARHSAGNGARSASQAAARLLHLLNSTGATLSAFDYSSSTWEPLRIFLAAGDARADIANQMAFLGHGRSLEVRLSATHAVGLVVVGPGPDLSTLTATPLPGTSP